MDYEIFEGKKSVKCLRRKREREEFEKIQEKLGLKRSKGKIPRGAFDLVLLCASVGFYSHIRNNRELEQLPNLKKLSGMSVFDERKLFDYLIITRLNTKKNRLEKFEILFYTGFKILKEWFERNGPDIASELEAFSNLWDYVKKM